MDSTTLHPSFRGQGSVDTDFDDANISVLLDNGCTPCAKYAVRNGPRDASPILDECRPLLAEHCPAVVTASSSPGRWDKGGDYSSISGNDRDHDGDGLSGEEKPGPQDGEQESWCEKYTSCRWVLAYLLCTMTMAVHCLRNCMSMAFVCIHEAQVGDWNRTMGNETERWNTSIALYIRHDQEGLVLSAYFYGYLVTPLLSGIIAHRWGARRVISVSMALSAALTLLTPVVIRHSVTLTVILRILLGAVSGGAVPCPTAMWSTWAPRHEKAKLVTITFMGASAGTVIANLASGFLCSIPLSEGWPFIFYTYGFLVVVWLGLWQYSARDSPEVHPRIQKRELALIQRHRGSVDPTERSQRKLQVPWRRILTSGPFQALLITHVAFIWLLNFFGTYIPLYNYHQLHFDAVDSGVLSSAPFILALLTSILAAVLSDRLQVGSLVSVTTNRKLFQCTGLTVAGGLLCSMCFVRQENRMVAVVMMTVAVGFHNICSAGFRINPLDLSPPLAGRISGVTQTFSNLTQIICMVVTSAVVADGQKSSWVTMFIVTGCVGFTGSAAFLIFGSGELQPWA